MGLNLLCIKLGLLAAVVEAVFVVGSGKDEILGALGAADFPAAVPPSPPPPAVGGEPPAGEVEGSNVINRFRSSM